MRFYCEFRWHPGVSAEEVRRRIVELYQANTEVLESTLKGWYTFPGCPSGFLVVETSDTLKLTQLLVALHDVMAFEVKPLLELPVRETMERWGGQLAATR